MIFLLIVPFLFLFMIMLAGVSAADTAFNGEAKGQMRYNEILAARKADNARRLSLNPVQPVPAPANEPLYVPADWS